jgi:predicted RNA-binding Zn-ribbon protein involved in translation (DUF1610 family)
MYELRDASGMLGAFDSEGIRQLASDGRLHGKMEIRQLPAGEWHPISKVKNLPVSIANQPSARAMLSPAVPTAVPVAQAAVAVESDFPCPFCGESIKRSAKKCKHCGEFLDPVLRASSVKAAPSAQMPVATTVNVSNVVQVGGVVKRWSPLAAAFLSFLIPGLGQLYKGQIINGIVWFVVVAIGYVAFIVPGLILHFCCVIGAATGNPYR